MEKVKRTGEWKAGRQKKMAVNRPRKGKRMLKGKGDEYGKD
jgi:hypothetical protein